MTLHSTGNLKAKSLGLDILFVIVSRMLQELGLAGALSLRLHFA
jgi:hypothetical protein